MKKGIFTFVLLMLIALFSVAQAGSGFAMEPAFIITEPGTELQFTYTVPEGYVVETVEWSWSPSFTPDGSSQVFLADSYGEGVIWQGDGRISLPEASMVRVSVRLNGTDYIYAYAAVPSPESAFTYTISDGQATITGRDDSQLSELLIIPPTIDGYPVTAIGDKAFRDLPSGVGGYVWIPDSVRTLGKEAFAASAYISMVYLSRNLTAMGEGAFGACLQMSDIRIPSSLTEIPAEAFANCWGLGLRDNLQRYVGSNTQRIGDRAFVGCRSLQSGDGQLPSSLTHIGEGAFWGCSALTTLTLPAGIDDLPAQTFQDCTGLTAITFAGEMTQLGASAFEGCTALAAIDLSGLDSIGTGALRGCAALETVTLGANLSYLGNEAFYGCTGLTAFAVAEDNAAFTAHQSALMTKDKTRLIAYPASAPAESFIAPDAMVQADNGAFHNLSGLKELTLPSGFADYPAWMFKNAASLEQVHFPEYSLTEIPEGFFYGCASLVQPTSFAGVERIDREAFRGCAALPSLRFDDALSNVEAYAFASCTALSQVTLGQYTSSLGAAAFQGCTALQTFTLPQYLYTVENMTFEGCSALAEVTWNSALSRIGSNAFNGAALTSLVLPESVTIIDSGAFANNAALDSATLHEGIARIGASAFASTGLKSVTLPDSLTQLGNAAFMNCTALTSLHIGSALKTIPVSAFEGCASLAAPELPDAVTAIASRAFAGCAAMARIRLAPGVQTIAQDAFTGCAALTICGWRGTAAEAAAAQSGMPFEALDAALTYALNADGTGYLVAACDAGAYSVHIPAMHNDLPVTGIQSGAFAACAALTGITVDAQSAALTAADGILYTADGTTLLLCPANHPASILQLDEQITAIGDYAFAGARNLTALYIGDQVTSIGSNAFADVNASFTIYAGSGSVAAEYAAAAGVPCMPSQAQFTYRIADGEAIITGYTGASARVALPDQLDGYPVTVLESLNNQAVEVLILSDSVHTLSGSALMNQAQLREVQLGSGLRTIGNNAFLNCTALTSLALPDFLTTIGAYAFAASGLTALHIPAQVSDIGVDFLDSCTSLDDIQVDAANPCYAARDGLLYNLTDSTLIYALPGLSGQVTVMDGTTVIADFVFKQRSGVTAVTLPDGLTRIGDSAFAYCTQLAQINLPDSLTQIGDSAFMSCISLTSVDIPAGVTSLYGAFRNCYALTDVTLREGLTSLINGVFADCRVLKTLHLPATLTELSGDLPPALESVTTAAAAKRYQVQSGILYDTQENVILFVNDGLYGHVTIREGITAIADGAFRDCTGLTSITLPEGLTTIGQNAFCGCSNLASVTFPESLEAIRSSAFRGTAITSVDLTSGALHHLGSFAFAECHALTEATITVPDVLLDEYIFSKCTALRTALLPETVGRLEGGTFNGCTALESVTLPRNITRISHFSNCSSLQEITLPDTVTIIDDNAFVNCTSLTSINIPDGVTTIGSNAFSWCYALAEVSVPAALTQLGENAFFGTAIREAIIPDGVTEIPANAFAYCSNLSVVTLPDTLTVIGPSAFEGTSSLQEVTLPAALTVLGERAFAASGLTMVIIPEGVTEISGGTFYKCGNLAEVDLSVGVTAISPNAFNECTSLTGIQLPHTVTEIGSYAFANCAALTSVTGNGTGILSICDYAFIECALLEEVTVSDGLTYVGSYAFSGCKQLRRVSSSAELTGAQLPSVQVIGENAFAACSALPQVIFSDVLTSVGKYAFDQSSFTSISFPDSVTYLGSHVVWRNPNLTYVRLPAGLIDLPAHMFDTATRLDNITLPATLKTIGTGAFQNSTALGALILPEGLEKISWGAFQRAEMLLYVPASVTFIQDDAFDLANVTFYCPADSYAAQYAAAHNIPVVTDQSIPQIYLGTGAQAAAAIVSQVITGDMTPYQKAEALVDWMLANVTLDDNVQDSISSKQALILRKSSRWGWSYAYKELLLAAGLTTDIYHTSGGYIEGEIIGSGGSFSITYFDGEAVNMIRIGEEWYFTHPAYTEHFGKADYFMLNSDRYYHAFGEYPEVPDCDGYEQTYLYQEFGRDIEENVASYASEEFAAGQKLVYADVSTEDVPYAETVLDYAGQHMDTLDWAFEGEAFEPSIIGTDEGYWLSGDLTGEYAEVTFDDPTVTYGETLAEPLTYTAELCGLEVEGELTLEEAPAEALSVQSRSAAAEPITKPVTYLATFTPMLSAYIDTLEPTTFTFTLECVLPALTDACTVTRQGLSLQLAEDHIFPENAWLELLLQPMADSAQALSIRIPDTVESFPEGVCSIVFDAPIPCQEGWIVSVQRTADGLISSETQVLATLDALADHPWNLGAYTVKPTCDMPGEKLYTCSSCGTTKTEETQLHLWSNAIITAEPTEDMPGEITYTCLYCDATCTEAFTRGLPGDVTEDAIVDMLDIIDLMEWYCCGGVSLNIANGEVTGDDTTDMLDIIALMAWYCTNQEVNAD